jgi:hypothetical protein
MAEEYKVVDNNSDSARILNKTKNHHARMQSKQSKSSVEGDEFLKEAIKTATLDMLEKEFRIHFDSHVAKGKIVALHEDCLFCRSISNDRKLSGMMEKGNE